ncbi:hypothetical protein [Nocardia tengchongensis]
MIERRMVREHGTVLDHLSPSSELTGMWTNPGTRPTLSHGHITHGPQL